MHNKFRLAILGVSLLGLKAILTGISFFLLTASPTGRISEQRIGETGEQSAVAGQREAQADFGKVPLSFEANQGQTGAQVKFLSRGNGYTLFLTSTEAVLTLKKGQSDAAPENAVLRISLDKANVAPEITAQNELPGKSNYFSGQSQKNWRTDVQTFARVHYKDVYPGVDQIFYGNGRQLEYDFIVAPHADPKQIALNFEGVEKIELDHEGELILQLKDGIVRQHKPVVYQTVGDERKEVAGNYVLKNETQIGFEIGEYDASKPLVIDPVLVYSTYLGGTGYDAGNAIAVDNAGNAYITGSTTALNFPTTPGSYQPAPPGGYVTKLNAAGNGVVFSTYLAGLEGTAIAVDAAGNVYVAGSTLTANFPVTPGAFQTGPGGFDIGLAKLNAAGNALVYSSRFGGDFDDFVRDIALDAAGNAYLAGWTKNPTPISTFPVVNAFQPNYGGGNNDGFVTKVNATGTALVYSTYLGAGEILNATDDWAEGIAVDSAGSAYVTGYTYSPDFPVTQGAYDTTRCGLDAFVTKFAPDGRSLVYSTFLGGCGGREQGMGIAVDGAGNAFVAGITESQDFPTTAGAFQTTGTFDAFVTKLNPSGSALVYSTYLGGNDVDRGWGIAIDNSGNAVVTGDTKSRDFPTTTNAPYPAYRGGLSDAFVTKLNATGTALVFSTYLGGTLTDEGRGIATQGNGNIYATGNTSSFNFPTTAGAFQMQNAGGNNNHDDAYVVKLSDPSGAVRKTPFDFDGDGKADVAVFRSAGGSWFIQQSSDNVFRAVQFGLATDRIAPADYDGDGKTDVAVYRDGTWYLLRSQAGFTSNAFGASGDIPVPADFDGDGKSELAVFRPSNGTWYFYNLANNQVSATAFGQAGDKPVAADYDGDGKADVAVFRAGTWFIQRSQLGFTAMQFGEATDKPVAADYDGDGKADVAVFRPGQGTWYLMQSANGFRGQQFGLSGDIAVPADYDGDGKADLAVFRQGAWYILQSANNALRVEQFGTGGDVPVPQAVNP